MSGGSIAALPRAARSAAAIVLGVVLLTASAKLELPFWPVPMTLETLAALGLAGFLGARLAGASVLLWLATGFAGLPVFAGPAAGPVYFMGPTAGYLIGLFAATLFVGWLVDRGLDARPARLFLAMLGGVVVVYLCGASYLASIVGGRQAIALGVLPFVLGDLTKAALAAALVTLWRRLPARRS